MFGEVTRAITITHRFRECLIACRWNMSAPPGTPLSTLYDRIDGGDFVIPNAGGEGTGNVS